MKEFLNHSRREEYFLSHQNSIVDYSYLTRNSNALPSLIPAIMLSDFPVLIF